MDVCHQGWHVPLSTITKRQTYKSWCNFATWPKRFQRRWFVLFVFFVCCQPADTCVGWKCNSFCQVPSGESKNCLSLRVVCIWVNAFASHEVLVKRVHWCIIICNKSTSTSWVVEDTRLCLSNIVTFTQSRHEELPPKTHITIDIFILLIVISLSILNSWKVFLKIVLQVGNVIYIFKTSLRSTGRPHGDQRFVRFCSFHGVYKKLKEGEETKKVQHCRKIQRNFLTYHGFYPHKKEAFS